MAIRFFWPAIRIELYNPVLQSEDGLIARDETISDNQDDEGETKQGCH